MAEDDDLGAIFGNPKEEVSEPEDMETTPGAPPVKILPVAPADKGAAAFDTPEPKAVAGRKGGLRGKSVSPKRKLQFGTDSDEEEGKVQAVNPPQRTKRVAKRRRGQSLPAPALVVTAPPDDDDEEEEAGAVPRRSPRKPPTTRRFDPAKAGAARKKRRASPKEEDDEEEEAANKNRQKKRKAANKTKQTKKRKNGKAKKESEEEDDEEEGDAVGDEDERDEDFGNRKPAPKKKRKATTSDKDAKKSPSKKVPLANENQINEKVEQEMEVLSEYFADVDDTPLEEEEPPGTKWVSMPMLKSPQRIERLAKYPTIAKDYDDYKKALTEAQVEPAPITEFVKDLEDKRLEAVIQP